MKLFQITEEDLSELERMAPDIAQSLMQHVDNRVRVQLRRTKDILSNVRWGYGPASNVTIIPANGEAPPEPAGSND